MWLPTMPITLELRFAPEVQTMIRSNETEQFSFLLNFTSKVQPVTFKEPPFDLLEEQKLGNHTEIPPYGVRLVRYKR